MPYRSYPALSVSRIMNRKQNEKAKAKPEPFQIKNYLIKQWSVKQTEREESMEYSIKLNAVNNQEKSVRAFATVTFGDCFKITNIAVVEGKDNQTFVSMPSFKSKERTEHNEPVYKDVCNPITSEFRKALYDDILSLYAEMEQTGRAEVSRAAENPQEPEFRVAVTPFEREGSNIRGLARIYFEDSFVVSNVSVIQGKEKEFVAMPSHMVKQTGKDGKPQYQDVCFPVTKEFREKLYQAITECYKQEKEKAVTQGREQAAAQSMARAESRQPERDLPFR